MAWDVRRQAWRSFRMDRVRQPALAGVRFAERVLPAVDAAAFVAESFASMPVAYEATLAVQAPAAAVADATRWVDAQVEVVSDGPCRVRLRAESVAAMVLAVAVVAIAFEIRFSGPDEIVAGVAELAGRLGAGGSAAGAR